MTPDEHTEARAREALHRLLESLGDATGVLLDLRTYLEALDAYYSDTTQELLVRGRRLLRAAALIGFGVVVALGVSAAQQRNIEQAAMKADIAAADVKRVAVRNTLAIRVSCTLLTNAILESGAGGSGQPARTPAAKAQRANTELYIGAIVRRLLTPAERGTLRENARIVAKAGGVISTPDCDEVAKHPERVRELALGPSRDPARRSPTVP